MKISLKWLNDYIDIKDFFEKPDELARILTQAGLEVEDIQNRAKDFANVVVGHILERGQHPNADRLTLCQVSTGGGVIHQIVCGAKNHQKDDRVVVALPGAVLPGDFKIKHSVIRGVESQGMLCSEKELGIAEEAEGIVILPKDAPLGASFAAYMGFDDVVLELKVTPNRSDCLSHFGLAREISTLLGRPFTLPFKEFQEGHGSTKNEVKLDVRDAEGCPRYTGRFMKGVRIAPSPAWMKKRLEAVGLRAINNVVDVTNYVMMELGQPMHAFDVRDIHGRTIVVDRAGDGEKFKTLDGTEIQLKGHELVIRDAERPVALAGVVGGLNSGVKEDTADLFLECAYFNQATVRRSARANGIETDSSYRFARGVNPEGVLLALNRCAELIQQTAGGEIYGDIHDFYPHPVKRAEIHLSVSSVGERLGYPVSSDALVTLLKRLDCEVDLRSAGEAVVRPPLYRWDLRLDVDLIEEYARITGYEKIPETLPALSTAPANDDTEWTRHIQIHSVLRRAGFQQAVNYAFVSSRFQAKFLGGSSKFQTAGLDVANEPVRIQNPLNEELDVMRVSLLPGLVGNLLHNYRHGIEFGRLFETGYTFRKDDSGYGQRARLAFLAWGSARSLWQAESKRAGALVFEAKASVEELLRTLSAGGKAKWKWDAPEGLPDFLHPGQSAVLQFKGRPIGFVGSLHPALKEEFKLRVDAVVAELDLDVLMKSMERSALKAATPSKFPAVERDIALVMPSSLSAGMVLSEMKKAAGNLLVDASVFDVFEGAPLEAGSKSVAFRLVYQDPQATLLDEKVVELQQKVLDAASKKFQITVR